MSKNIRDFLCIYIDLENISKNVDLQKIMNDIVLKYETKDDDNEPIFAFKIACGNTTSINNYREKLKNQNFEIRETPHIAEKKNRSDLIISLDAFEKLYLDRPSINEYIFVTNDSDFSVIMDILRRYGKRVVLVTTEKDSKREIFNNCSDEILIINDYLEKEEKDKKIKNKNILTNNQNDNVAISNLIKVLKVLDPDKEYLNSQVGSKFNEIDKSFDIKKTTFKKFNKLVDYFEIKGLLKVGMDNKNKKITSINLEGID